MKFDNLVIFVADSLRYDFSPDGLMDTDVKFKTVAQSTHSPPSFSTLSTGLYPYQHGVHGWTDKIPADIETVFDVETQELATSSAAARRRTQCTRFLMSNRRPRYRT